jgi:vacuolar-type H+-ATPase subunit D/Vma8
VFPTRQSLGIMKAKLKGAETGHSLLKRKSEALTKYVTFVPLRSYNFETDRHDF